MQKIICIFFVQSLGLLTCAQSPEEWLSRWNNKAPIEKVYVHFDREQYLAGETIWFKAYLASDYQPDTISTSLYVELINEDTKVITRNVFPVLLGGTNGQIELADSLLSGTYTVRAYTASMAMTAPGFIFQKGLHIYGKKPVSVKKTVPPAVKIEFFPEGGNAVYGRLTTIAFKASNEYGLPVPIQAVVRNSRQEAVAVLKDYHDGMGMFEMTPVRGEKYYAEAGGIKYPLPDPVEKGIALTIIPHPQGNFFEIQQAVTDPVYTAAYMIGQMQNRMVFRQEFSGTKESLQGIINTQQLHSGILQVTVFNATGIPLAERLCFVNNKEYAHPAVIITDTIDCNPKGRNRFSISLKDTVQGSLSISITDADYETEAGREENILTGLLLTSDIRGYVHRPAWYFSADNDSVETALDLVMMTNGWRRFRWEELTGQPSSAYQNPPFITLAGKVTLRGSNRAFDNKDLLLMINNTGTPKRRSTHMLQTDKDGYFRIDSLVFFDRNRLLFSDIRGKKGQYIDVKLGADSILRNYYPPGGFITFPVKETNKGSAGRWQNDYDEIRRANGILLDEVVIQSKSKNKMQTVDERYTQGLFGGDAARAIDLVNSDEATPYNNIFDYLQSRVNGLVIAADGFDYTVYYRQGASISSMGNIAMTLFLDEIETDASVIATVPANQVALVKLFSSFAGAWGNAPGGVLAIYTKKGEDFTGPAGMTNTLFYNGYTVVKEFYAPDFTKGKTITKADNRITLDWRPNIFINNVNPRIPVSFYNNDRTKRYKVVAEGMTTSGKLIWVEKIIEGNN